MKYFKIISFLLFALFLTCNESDSEEFVNSTISASDFAAIIIENPSINEILGVISATTNQGEITFVIIDQNLDGAFNIDLITGEISVNDPTLFDFETNPILSAIVEVSNGDITETVTITIELIDADENSVTAFDLEIALYEIPTINQYLGIIEGYADDGNVTFSSLDQSPSGTLEIDFITGEIHIIDNLQFVNHEIIEATIRVQLEDVPNTYQDVMVRVYLTYVCDTNNSPSLLAHYPFDGNSLDESNYNNHGVVDSPVLTNDRFSQDESAYYFDGIDDVIYASDAEQLYLGDEFTISAWIYPEEIKTQQIIRKGNAVNGVESWPYGLALSETNDMIFSVTADGVLYQARLSGYNINEWYLITGVLKDQRIYLYINGELMAYEIISGSIYDDSLPLLIGTRLSLPSSTFKGSIDDVRVYNTALCEEDIMNLYTN
ncbi:LamG-like jellyroll fold domain-containing protein [Psychroserpens sp.]